MCCSLQGKKIVRSRQVGKRLAGIGLAVVGSTPEEIAAYRRAEIAKRATVLEGSGARVT